MRDQNGAISPDYIAGRISDRPPAQVPAVGGVLARENGRLFLLALLVFLLNQGLEFTLLRTADAEYRALCGWDCGWYVGLMDGGYDEQPHAHPKGDAANWAFFPAFPLAADAMAKIAGLSSGVALLVTSKLFFLLSIFAFIKFAQVWAPTVPPWLAAAVVGFQPYALYGNVGYTESMFLLFTCLGFHALGTGRFIHAGIFGAVLSAVRPVGVFMVVPLLIAGARRLPVAPAEERLRILVGAMLVPVGLSLFMIYLHRLTGDALAFAHVQIAWDRVPSNPLVHLWQGLLGAEPMRRLWALMSAVALGMAALLFVRRQYELGSFALVATLVPLSTGLLAMPRYLWWQAPLLLLMAQGLSKPLRFRGGEAVGRQPAIWMVALPLSLWGYVIMMMAWVNGEWFVV